MPDSQTLVAEGEFDFIIIGGGSAGCVLANRLSANSGNRVALIEAGQDPSLPVFPERIADPGFRTAFAREYYWPAFAEVIAATQEGHPARMGMALIARVLGGGSIVNGLHANRGMARDYDEWSSSGVQGWGASDVLPYFKRLETDLDFTGPNHGDAGPIHIQRIKESQWSTLSTTLRDALEKRGLPRVTDFNDMVAGDGVGPTPHNFGATGRMSANAAYLTPAVRKRFNLSLLNESHVNRILFTGRAATGVHFQSPAGTRTLRGRHIIVSAGALQSPALLQRSGIGSPEELNKCGIPVVVARQATGRNLTTHPLLSINTHLRAAARRTAQIRPPCPMIVRYSSGRAGCPSTDMYINVWERTTGSLKNDPAGRQTANLMLQLNKCFSVGDVRLNPADPMGMPTIRFNLLSDDRDRLRMSDGLCFILDLLAVPALASLTNESYLTQAAKLPPLALRMLQGTRGAKVVSRMGALLLDGPATLRRRILSGVGTTLNTTTDRDQVDCLVRDHVMAGAHPVGTCRMGDIRNPEAVTDSRCRVIDIAGVRVVDASIFPTSMTAGPNLPVMMAAEKAADMIFEDLGVR